MQQIDEEMQANQESERKQLTSSRRGRIRFQSLNPIPKKQGQKASKNSQELEPMISRFTQKIRDKKIEDLVTDRYKEATRITVLTGILADLTVLLIFFTYASIRKGTINRLSRFTIATIGLRTTVLIALLIKTLKNQLNCAMINGYIYLSLLNTMYDVSVQSAVVNLNFFKLVNNAHTATTILRNTSNYFHMVFYCCLFSCLYFLTSPVPSSSDSLFIIYLVFFLAKEYNLRYILKKTDIQSIVRRENDRVQLAALDYLPTAVTIIDLEGVYFSSEWLKKYFNIRNAQDFLLKLKEMEVNPNLICKKGPFSDHEDGSNQFGDDEVNVEFSFDREESSGLSRQNGKDSTGKKRSEREIDNLETDDNYKKKEFNFDNCKRNLFQLLKNIQKKKKQVNLQIRNVAYNDKTFDMFVISVDFQNKYCFLMGIIDSTTKNQNLFLEDLNLYQNKILGYISHNLKTPLTFILNYLEKRATCLKNPLRSEEGSEIDDPMLDIAYQGVHELLELNNDIKTFTELSNGSLKIDKERINLEEMIRKVIRKFSLRSLSKGVQITYEIDEIGRNGVYTSKKGLKQILTNLLRNAIKHTDKGDIKVIVKKPSNDVMKISVMDTGMGMNDSQVDFLRLMFKNPVKGSIQRDNEKKMGLGLIICHHLTKLLAPASIKEHFLIESEEMYGTAIHFFLDISRNNPDSKRSTYIYKGSLLKDVLNPIHKSKDKNLQKITEYKSPKIAFRLPRSNRSILADSIRGTSRRMSRASFGSSSRHLKVKRNTTSNFYKDDSQGEKCDCYDVMLVDDEIFTLKILDTVLRQNEYLTATAMNGAVALEKLEGKCPKGHLYKKRCKVVMTDINMPIMGGFELCKKIRAKIHKGEFEYMAVIGNTANDVEKKGYERFDNVFTKPFNVESILPIVEECMAKRDAMKLKEELIESFVDEEEKIGEKEEISSDGFESLSSKVE
jgi:signal transduction histidine kinase/CheY-like chemotaxis protein